MDNKYINNFNRSKKNNKFIALKQIMLSVIIFLLFSSSSIIVFGYTLVDVDKTHWAYNSIKKVLDSGTMKGNLKGEFLPNEKINKFESVQILASLAGYKSVGATQEEQLYYNRCYENNKKLLSEYSQKYKKWNAIYNKEISFLLEKQILTVENINDFVIIDKEKEAVKNITREEMVYFISLVFDKRKEMNLFEIKKTFADDKEIDDLFKKSVYYLNSFSIVNPDKDNNFNPNDFLSRAQMAVIIDRTLLAFKINTNSANSSNTAKISTSETVNNISTNDNSINVETLQAKITQIHKIANAITISTNNVKFDNKVINIAKSAPITIDGYIQTFEDLKANMIITGAFLKDSFISINAISENTSDYLSVNMNLKKSYLIEKKIVNDKVSVELQTVTYFENGDAISNNKIYTLSPDVVINKDDRFIKYDELEVNNILYIKEIITEVDGVSSSYITNIKVIQEDLELDGFVTNRYYDKVNKTTYINIRNLLGEQFLVKGIPGSKIFRQSVLDNNKTAEEKNIAVDTSAIKVGDAIKCLISNGMIVEGNCVGNISTIEATIKELYIAENISKVTVLELDGETNIYRIDNSKIDVYKLRVGAKIKFKINSLELEEIL